MSKTLMNVFEAPLKGISLVEASAGTGKTYNITSLYVRAVLEKNLLPSQILVMTYTEAATAELKYRIRKRLNESLEALLTEKADGDTFLQQLLHQPFSEAPEKLRKAIDSFDEAAVFTIHGFCNRILSEFSLHFDVSPNFELLTDDSELLQDCVDDYWRDFITKAEENSQLYVLLDYLTDTGFGPDELKSVLSEIMKHPEAVLEPQNLNYESLLGQIDDLNAIFKEVKRLWELEGAELENIYRGDALKRNIYQKSTEDRHWDEFQQWLNQSSIKVLYPDSLVKFGLKLSRSGKKNTEIPELALSTAIDQYIDLAQQLKLLKPAFIKKSVAVVQDEYNSRKKDANLLTYNDLLELVEKGLKNKSGSHIASILNQKYPVALVDEFQDTDPIQYSIFRQIYFGKNKSALFMIGDPKQAIYGFRGADIYTYLEAREDAHEEQRYSLSYNYRSNEGMIEAVNTLFTQAQNPFVIDKLNFDSALYPRHKGEKPVLYFKNDKFIKPLQSIKVESSGNGYKKDFRGHLYAAVADEILALLSDKYKLNDRRVEQKDIAILIRKGAEGDVLQDELKKRGLKSVMRSRNSVFKTNVAEELFLILKSIYHISYESGVRAALCTELLGFQADDILQLNENEEAWSEILERFLTTKEQWEKYGIESAIDELSKQFSIQHKLAELPDSERRITNVLHLSELLSKAQREQKLTGIGLLKWFHHKMNDDATDSDDEVLRLESDEDLIQISTMHGAKGLEYNIVFCPFLWEEAIKIKNGNLLKFHQDGKTHLDISLGIDHPKRTEFETQTSIQQLAESIRLAYVALTRSVAACYLFVPDFKNISESPLGVLFAGNQAHADYEKITGSLAQLPNIELRTPFISGQSSELTLKTEKTDLTENAHFRRKDLFEIPRIISYSLLSQAHSSDDQIHDYDADFNYALPEGDSEKLKALNHFSFPKGANAGTCLHKIFEDISFTETELIAQLVEENLEYYGFDDEWKKPVSDWISSCLNQPFGEPPITLRNLPEQDVLKEMEFLFPVQNVKTDQLWKLIRRKNISGFKDHETYGFMKGYIDLTFTFNNRYYILDYKSNYLGDKKENYGNERLQETILEAGYDLQYHIYTLALHRYLKQRADHYKYENHFGGVLYFFIRGMDVNEPGSGIFFHRPEFSLVQQLDDFFREGDRA